MKNNYQNELVFEMQRILESSEKLDTMNNITKVIDYLNSAAEIFEEVGLIKKADQVLKVLAKIAIKHKKPIKKNKKPVKRAPKKDWHTEGLTPDKMVQNLLHHGTEFNMSDDGDNFITDPIITLEEEVDPCYAEEDKKQQTDSDFQEMIRMLTEEKDIYDQDIGDEDIGEESFED